RARVGRRARGRGGALSRALPRGLESLGVSGLRRLVLRGAGARPAGSDTRDVRARAGRLEPEPERALPHAYELVRLAPYDEAARATLIRLLVAVGRTDQAEQ